MQMDANFNRTQPARPLLYAALRSRETSSRYDKRIQFAFSFQAYASAVAKQESILR